MKSMKLLVLIAIVCVFIARVCQGMGHGPAPEVNEVPDFARLDEQLRAIINNKSTPDSLLLEAISRLGRISEPATFWTQIANDPSYSIQHRTRAVFALFRRHGEEIGELHLLGQRLKPAKWLEDSSVEKMPFVFGWAPMVANPGESVFCISVFYGSAIYIRLPGDVEERAVRKALSCKEIEDSDKDLIVMQFGYGDDYDQWLRSPVAMKPK